MNRNYKILGVNENATDAEIYSAYTALRSKYREEMFEDGKKGNDAAKKLTELERAYEEITTYRREHDKSQDDGLLKQVDLAIKNNDLKRAQELLDTFNERGAEWHYLQAVVFYKKGWANESRKQLEIARQMAPGTDKYEKAYAKLNDKFNNGGSARASDGMNGSQNGAPNYGATNGGAGNYDEPQMGGDGCFDFCCRLAICNLLLNCCCNCR